MSNRLFEVGDRVVYQSEAYDASTKKMYYKQRPGIIIKYLQDDMCVVLPLSTMKNKQYIDEYSVHLSNTRYPTLAKKDSYILTNKPITINQRILIAPPSAINIFKQHPSLADVVVKRYEQYSIDAIVDIRNEQAKYSIERALDKATDEDGKISEEKLKKTVIKKNGTVH